MEQIAEVVETAEQPEVVEADAITDSAGKEVIPPQADMDEPTRRKVALDIVESRIFGSWMMRDSDVGDMLGLVFMPLVLGARLPPNAHALYEYVSEAGPRAINGYPTFFSCRILTEADTKAISVYAADLDAKRIAFLNESPGQDLHNG